MTEPQPFTVSYVTDHTMDAPDGHSWVRPSIDCPNCVCCSLALCQRAHDRSSTCWHEGGGNHEGQHPLDPCPCAPLGGPLGVRPEIPAPDQPRTV